MQTDTLSRYLVLLIPLLLSACGGGGQGDTPESADTQSVPNVSNQLIASDCAIAIPAGRVTVPTTLVNMDSACDYYISGDISVSSDLTIEPGTTVLVAQNAQVFLTDGALNAVGTADNRITIKGERAESGFWQGITMASIRPSRVEYVDIMDGGNASPVLDEFRGGLVVRGTETSLVDISVSNSFVDGVRIDRFSTITEFSKNRFYGNSQAGINLSSQFIPLLDTASDYLGENSPNGNRYIHVRSTLDVGADDVWKKFNAPYFLEGGASVSSGEQITVMPGVEILVNRGRIWALNEGSFRFEGTTTEPISVKPSSGQAGSWAGFNSTTGGELILTNTEIDGAVNGVNMGGRGMVNISDSLISNSIEWGIDCHLEILSESAVLKVSGNMRYINNALGDIDEECVVQ